MRPHALLLVAVASIGLLAPAAADAAWPSSSTVNVPIFSGRESLGATAIVTDGQSGVIAFGMDAPSPHGSPYGRGIRAFRLLANGVLDARWPADGLLACGDAHTAGVAHAASDGLGGAYIVWSDIRAGQYRLFAQHVREDGVVDPAWPDSGLSVCPDAVVVNSLDASSDGAGGLFVWWQDLRDPDSLGAPIQIQRLLPNGARHPGWPADGVPITTGYDGMWPCRLVPDGGGGALLTWITEPHYPMAIMLQHVLASGSVDPTWDAGGVSLLPDSAVVASHPAVASDGAGGVLIAWVDMRDDSATRIYAMRVGGDGQPHPAWPAGGTLVLISGYLPYNGSAMGEPFVCEDGEGGMVIAWQDGRSVTGWDLYAHRVLADGALDTRWPDEGRAISLAHTTQAYPSLRPDGTGGAYVGWADPRSQIAYEVFLQRVLGDGTISGGWPQSGRAVCTGPTFHGDPVVLPTTPPGALLAWPDRRAGQRGVYAQRVNPDGTLGDGVAAVGPSPRPSTVALAAPLPNPAARTTRLRFTLTRAAHVRLDILDAAGRRVRTLVSATRAAGAHEAHWDLLDGEGAPVHPGWYLARLEGAGGHAARPLVVRR